MGRSSEQADIPLSPIQRFVLSCGPCVEDELLLRNPSTNEVIFVPAKLEQLYDDCAKFLGESAVENYDHKKARKFAYPRLALIGAVLAEEIGPYAARDLMILLDDGLQRFSADIIARKLSYHPIHNTKKVEDKLFRSVVFLQDIYVSNQELQSILVERFDEHYMFLLANIWNGKLGQELESLVESPLLVRNQTYVPRTRTLATAVEREREHISGG